MQATAYMATFPPRINALRQSIPSLMNQVSHLHIFCNNYSCEDWAQIQDLLRLPNVSFYDGNKVTHSNIGALGKVIFCHTWESYIFTVDDDFVYPYDYVKKSIQHLESYANKAVITYHGQSNRKPCKSYYNDLLFRNTSIRALPDDVRCEIPGTGVMAFHADIFKDQPLNMGEFMYTNMLDLLFGIALNRRHIPAYIASHKANWIRVAEGFRDPDNSIWIVNRHSDGLHTEIYNAAKFES